MRKDDVEGPEFRTVAADSRTGDGRCSMLMVSLVWSRVAVGANASTKPAHIYGDTIIMSSSRNLQGNTNANSLALSPD